MNSTNLTLSEDVSDSHGVYCGQGLANFRAMYLPIHGYTSLLVCLFGSVANILNIAVLTRREMSSPTNAILTGLALADLMVMLEYIPFICHLYLSTASRRDKLSYRWTAFVFFHSNFGQVCHTISIWLTVTLAVWRYIAVAYPQKNREWCSMKTTIIAIVSAYIVCPILCIPLYLSFSIASHTELLDADGNKYTNTSSSNGTTIDSPQNVTLYFVKFSQLATDHKSLKDVNFWVYSVIIKLIPCIALTVLSQRLVSALMEAKKRRQNLSNSTAMNIIPSDVKDGEKTKMLKSTKKSSRLSDKERQTDRTTRMLLAVLFLFLITEFPQAILGLLSGFLGEKFFLTCYHGLGEVMDTLALINSAINFILYCSMSRQFRTTFSQLFRPKILDRWFVTTHTNGENNGLNNTTVVTQV